MKTFRDVLMETEWENVQERFVVLYPDEAKSIDGYRNVYHTLKELNAKSNEDDTTIVINFVPDEEKPYYGVSGKVLGKELLYGLEFCDWTEWLGYYMGETDFSNEDFVAHCLWEMTWWGFTQEDIKKQEDLLNEATEDDYKEAVSLEDLLNED